MKLEGVYLPIITPFKDGEVDFDSYKKLIDFYSGKGISGFIPLGTTGESPVVSDEEYYKIVEKTIEYNEKKLPIFIGAGGNYTDKVIKTLKKLEKYNIDGVLSVCPYYNRPSQGGIYQHFLKLSESTDLNIIVYNIPYRTGRNIENTTIYRMAELKNIVALKDSCGDIKQSMELLINPPSDMSLLTGEDVLFYTTLTLGGNGGILASSHLFTERFINTYRLVKNNNHIEALSQWSILATIIPLLFEEPNPAPIKYCLNKLNLIASNETRLPITEASDSLKELLDNVIALNK